MQTILQDVREGADVPYGQGSFSLHSQSIMVAARAMAERRTFGHLP